VGQPIDYIKTGFRDLDNLIGGFRYGELIVVAARAKMGKTACLLDLCRYISKTTPVFLLSLEMSGPALLERLIASVALVPIDRLHAVDLTDIEKERITAASENIERLDLYIEDGTGLTPSKFTEYMGKCQAKFQKPFVVMIDYLQMMKSDYHSQYRTQELQDIIDSICADLKKYKACCIATSQLNREADKRENHWPRLSDLRESGYIEQGADKIIFIHRPDYYAVADGDFNTTETGEGYLIVAANRNGKAGFVKVAFISDITSFKNINKDDKIEIFDEKGIPF
jgi:replicative DNA helicase